MANKVKLKVDKVEILVNEKTRQKKAILPNELVINESLTLGDLVSIVNRQAILIDSQYKLLQKTRQLNEKEKTALEARITNLEKTVKELGGNL